MRAELDGVLLDIDETLIDSRNGFAAGLAAISREFMPHLSVAHQELVQQHWIDSQHVYQRYICGELSFLGQRQVRATLLHAEFGGPRFADEQDFARWNALYELGFADGWRLLPGAAELLGALVHRGVPVGAITNAEVSYQRRKLNAVGLAELPILVGLDTLGLGKPYPRVFRHGAAALGLVPQRCVYLGDQLEVDALGAAAAGLVGCWFRAGRSVSPLLAHELQPDSWADFSAWLGVDLGSTDQSR